MLDKTRPYGHVWGGSTRAKYEQDGKLYDAHGIEIEPDADADDAEQDDADAAHIAPRKRGRPRKDSNA